MLCLLPYYGSQPEPGVIRDKTDNLVYIRSVQIGVDCQGMKSNEIQNEEGSLFY